MLPSQLLRKMRALAGTDVSKKALRTLWLDKMPDSVKCIVIVSEEHLDKIAAMADKIVEMAPRTVDIAAVQDSAGVDQLMAKIATLEGEIASLKLQRKFRSPSPHHHQRSRSHSKSRRRYNPQGRYCFYHFRFGKKGLPGKCDENPGYLSRTEKPDVNSLWIAEQTSRSSPGQKRKLLIDLHNRKLIDGVTNLSIKGEVATIQENNDLSTVNRASKYFNLLNSYPDLIKPNLVNRVVKHGVKHHILTTGQPVYSKARQLAPDKLKLETQEFQFMLDNDIIRPSKSQWASPLHLVNKKDGTLRPCGDYRRLNAQTIPDRYPIPRIEDFNYILKDKKIFSKIDLVKAYYQIPIAEEDKEKNCHHHPIWLVRVQYYEFWTKECSFNLPTFHYLSTVWTRLCFPLS
ncbi:hypothetical protein TNCV_4301251 [Trichonephila clavipes]|uniref:Reverse transcriptase domain-containing protein n=1 Tax=Trichonephila clavipes TaxID=2585209 RepID=A0A8X6RU73_TRICX|nr:hypothetical protein TNCV_4301251 [Trichonephila clavipes]